MLLAYAEHRRVEVTQDDRDLVLVPLAQPDMFTLEGADTPAARADNERTLRGLGCEWFKHHSFYALDGDALQLVTYGKRPLHADWRQRMDRGEYAEPSSAA
jgi:hypothetical protein